MIETVIKRDGLLEPWNIKKLAKWQEWATDGGKVPWTQILEKVVARLKPIEKSRDIQMAFIDEFLALKTWDGNRSAGKLYSTVVSKDFYPLGIPTVCELHEKLQKLGFMKDLGYNIREYEEIEQIIDHKRDHDLAHFQIKQITEKYCLQDRVKKLRFETPQFVDMRLAMAMAEHEPAYTKIDQVKKFYDLFSKNIVNNPTPNYMYVGTKRSSSPSCCVYVIPDNVAGISAAHHICEMMASGGAGIGTVMKIRSLGDKIRGGELAHFGKKRYLDSHSRLAIENTAAGRSGALNTGFSIYDPDFTYMIMMQNPRTPISQRNRNSHVTVQDNPTFARRVARNEDFTPWNTYTAPGLWEIMTSGDDEAFETAYKVFEENNPNLPRFNAREVLLKYKNQCNQVGTVYGFDVCEINRHTPHRDPINSTNLCTEIALPTREFESVEQLYHPRYIGSGKAIVAYGKNSTVIEIDLAKKYKKTRNNVTRMVDGYCLLDGDTVELEVEDDNYQTCKIVSVNIDQQPEVALCNLSGIILPNLFDATDDEYFEACIAALKSIDYTIHNTTYRLPHVGWTAKKRLNAGVGIMGLATWLAKKDLRYDTRAGLTEIHKVAERHMYFLIKASIALGREKGNAQWIDRTKWVDGWLPIDDYKKGVDKFHDAQLVYDWLSLRKELIANGGMRFSSLFTIMPGESSSKKSGPPNSVYPIRQLSMKKSDSSNVIDWVAPFAEELKWSYQSAWDIDPLDLIPCYGILNKFTDQTVSCDLYRDRRQSLELSADKLIQEYLLMKEVGMPTHYYSNSRVAEENDQSTDLVNEGPSCSAEGCSL